jgi:heptosyltransferase-2
MLESGSVFIGNDSGPGHLAAASGLPTFTIFGPQFAELFLPLHPQRGWVEGKPCPYKPCFDACRYPAPHCILKLETAEVTEAVRQFLAVTAPKLSNGGDWSG